MAECKHVDCDKIAKNTGLCWGHYCRKRRNSPLVSKIRKPYNFNKFYFDIIDSPNKAYVLGLLITDGNVRKTRNTYCLMFGSKDKQLVKFILSELNSEHKIYYLKDKDFYYFQISNSYICKKLHKYGIVIRKSLIAKYPKYLNGYDRDFIRGCLDGDGCVIFEKSKKYNSVRHRINWVGTKKLLIGIEKILRYKLNLKSQNILNTATIYRLQYSAKNDIEKIKNFLYKKNDFYLKRKWEKLNEYA